MRVSMKDLMDELQAKRLSVTDAGRPDAVAKRRRFDAMTARERLGGMLDPDTFREIGQLVEPLHDNDFNRAVVAPADGIVTGTGKIAGRYANVAAHDFTVLGGSSGKVGSRKLDRLLERSAERGLPLVLMLEGGGHRIQDGMNAAHFAGASVVFQRFARLSGWVPVVSAMMGQGFAGPTNYSALSDFVVMVEGMATMGLAGPAIVKAGTGEISDKESLGGFRRQVEQQGIADLAVPDESACFEAIRRFLSYLPSNARAELPILRDFEPPRFDRDALLDVVPSDTRKVYDVRHVIERIADHDSLFELKPRYARNMVTGFARLAGRPVGFVANQPLRMAGMLDQKACEKAAHFVGLCDAFGLPLVFLIDVPGFAIGSSAESSGLGRRSGRLFFELGQATVPRASIVLRKGYGAGYYAMAGGRSFEADACYAWPTAEICAMSIEGAVDVAFRKEFVDADDPQAARDALVQRIRAQTGAINAAADFGVDETIDPRETRQLLIDTFESCPRRKASQDPPRFRPISPI
jgi:propionyl-CoA carboxylase beta chain